MRLIASCFAVALIVGLVVLPAAGVEIVDHAAAQDLPDPTLPRPQETGVFMIAGPTEAHQRLAENSVAQYEIRFLDASIEGAFTYSTSILTRCVVENQTADARGWSVGISLGPSMQRNDERTSNINIMSGMAASPRIFQVEVSCHAMSPLNREIGRFVLTAELETYQRFSVSSVGAAPRASPGDEIQLQAEVQNSGNEAMRYIGAIDAPQGWIFSTPHPVVLEPGESTIVNISGFAPRDKVWYTPSSEAIIVSYWPDGEPGRAQSQFFPVGLHGLYLHPALVPLILLSLLAVAFLVLLAVYARRTVEEQVLGKPIPPWRIPVEREYLSKLEKEDPDEFYIMRYHLMEEEHHSALMWYEHYKHATRKDRRHERAWLKKKEKMEAKTGRLERRHGRMKTFVAWRLRRVPRRRRRRLVRFDKKLHHEQWREQRRLLKIHRKSVKKIDKIHQKRSGGAVKEHKAQFEKEERRIAKENKRRIKLGDEPLSLPEEPELRIADPEFPEVVEVPLVAVRESRFAVRAQRRNDRFNRKIARRTGRAKKKLERKKAKLAKKRDRLQAKVPPEPAGELYREDEFVSEDEVVVEDARPVYQRALRIPSMETRDALKRRRLVYKAKIAQAKNENDPERVERLKQEYAEERARLLEAPAPKQKKQTDAKTEKSVDKESTDGGPLRLVSRRRKGGKGDPGDAAGDAANQGAKDLASVSKEDGSLQGDRSTED